MFVIAKYFQLVLNFIGPRKNHLGVEEIAFDNGNFVVGVVASMPKQYLSINIDESIDTFSVSIEI